MFTAYRVNFAAEPTSLVALTSGRRKLAVRNLSHVRVYLGGPYVTTISGFPLDPGEVFRTSTVGPEDVLYAVTDGQEAEVAVLYA